MMETLFSLGPYLEGIMLVRPLHSCLVLVSPGYYAG